MSDATVMGRRTPEDDRPDVEDAAHKEMAPSIQICRDFASGWDAVRNRGVYLPRRPKESGRSYSIRSNRPTFFDAFGRTLAGLTGLVFRRDPQLGDDVPPEIREHWENIDYAGTHGDVFCQNAFRDALVAGHGFIVVDMPAVKARNLAEERQLGLRPYWLHYRAEDAWN